MYSPESSARRCGHTRFLRQTSVTRQSIYLDVIDGTDAFAPNDDERTICDWVAAEQLPRYHVERGDGGSDRKRGWSVIPRFPK